MSAVTITGVEKAYGKAGVIHGVSVEITSGEFVILVGPSGCGKSTLLRMIAGLEDISGGEIALDGKVINDVAPKSRDIAMVFQNYALYPHMTVRENMTFALTLKKTDRHEIENKITRASAILGLQDLLDRYPRQLSGGQRQRVAMGRAIVRDPKVFLFDEPLSNLDAKLRVQMRTEIKALHRRLGTTIVYVTHDQVEAMTMADKIVVMNGGVVEQFGAPLDLYDRPANLFVAQFIGSPSMNILEGHAASDSFVAADGTAFPLQQAGHTGTAVSYGIRPEHLRLSDSGVPAVVEVVEPTGSETLVVTTAGRNTLSALVRERAHVVPGQRVFLAPDLAQIHLFDQRGKRVVSSI
ncbi:ABC transporter ATP-binding protein [Mesorhizobium newzealandense]|uniref:ABC transporter ATP-binding protein n=1 Tax=Mesorhizobium newzealandense TaxID=1300302 RepID=A0ABW4U5W3_9HYPH